MLSIAINIKHMLLFSEIFNLAPWSRPYFNHFENVLEMVFNDNERRDLEDPKNFVEDEEIDRLIKSNILEITF